MRAKRIILFLSAWIFVLAVGPAWAQFVPGHVFVSDPSQNFCVHGGTDFWDRIWEIDPETGEVTLFAEFFGEDCRFITGLVFTPDGCRLRASAMLTDEILEFAPDGTYAVALDADDGISAPWGSNNLAYDAEGNFHVVNAGRNIMRFPADGAAGIVLADNQDGVRGDGAIAIAADGDLYFGNAESERYVLRVTPQGDASIFDSYPIVNVPHTVTADDAGHVYVGLGWDEGGIFRYEGGDPESKQLMSSSSLFRNVYAMTMAPDQRRIYVACFREEVALGRFARWGDHHTRGYNRFNGSRGRHYGRAFNTRRPGSGPRRGLAGLRVVFHVYFRARRCIGPGFDGGVQTGRPRR